MRIQTAQLALAASVIGGMTPGAVAAHSLEIEGAEYAFKPARIEVEAGETVEITFENTGALSHNLTIPKLEAATETIQSGKTTTLTVTPEEPGSYEIRCSVPGHAPAGMTGELVVTE